MHRRHVRREAGPQVAGPAGVLRVWVCKFKAPCDAEGDNPLEPAHASGLALAVRRGKVEGRRTWGSLVPHAGDYEPCEDTGSRASLKGETMRGVSMSPAERWFPSHLKEIDKAECLELLTSHEVGRVAYCDGLGPVVLPVNYGMDHDTVLIQISPHSTLATHLRSAPASFETRRLRRLQPVGVERPGPRKRRVRRQRRPSRRRRPACRLGRRPAHAPCPDHPPRHLGPTAPARLRQELAVSHETERDYDDAFTANCSHPRPRRARDSGTLGAQHPALALVYRRRAGGLVRRQLTPAPVRRPGRAGPRDQLRRRPAPPEGGGSCGGLEGTGPADAESVQRRAACQRLLPPGAGDARRLSPRSTRSASDAPTAATPRPGRCPANGWTACSPWDRPPA